MPTRLRHPSPALVKLKMLPALRSSMPRPSRWRRHCGLRSQNLLLLAPKLRPSSVTILSGMNSSSVPWVKSLSVTFRVRLPVVLPTPTASSEPSRLPTTQAWIRTAASCITSSVAPPVTGMFLLVAWVRSRVRLLALLTRPVQLLSPKLKSPPLLLQKRPAKPPLFSIARTVSPLR